MTAQNTQDPPLTPGHNLRLAILSARRLAEFLDEHGLPIDNPIVQDELTLLNRRLVNSTDAAFEMFTKCVRAICPACKGDAVENEIITFKDARGVHFHRNKQGNNFRHFMCLADDIRLEFPQYSDQLDKSVSEALP